MKYNIDFFAFTKKIIPYFLRKTKVNALLKTIVKPLQTINGEFYRLTRLIDFRLTYNSQTIYFEKYLNDVYLVTATYPNNIHIVDKSNIQYFYLWNFLENQVDEIFFNYSENADSKYLLNYNDYNEFDVSFVVNVPISVQSGVDLFGQPFNELILQKRINDRRLAGKTFEIVYF